jgi:hypothetical protein
LSYKVAEGDPAAERLERRWFAAFTAASKARAECELLLDEMERVELRWQHARVRLAGLEELRDCLCDQLSGLHLDQEQPQAAVESCDIADVMSAA